MNEQLTTKKITLGGGCFWCIESAFNRLEGVIKAKSGYAAGQVENPSYQAVCAGTTGHAEVVQVEYYPNVISTEQLLRVFFYLHDPTQLNRQGNDIGTQYRSIILYQDNEQLLTTRQLLKEYEQQQTWPDPIVTEIKEAEIFYPAEAYHQGYAENNPQNPYCQMVVNPKLAKFANQFSGLVKSK